MHDLRLIHQIGGCIDCIGELQLGISTARSGKSQGAKSFDESWQNLLSAIESKGKELQTVS